MRTGLKANEWAADADAAAWPATAEGAGPARSKAAETRQPPEPLRPVVLRAVQALGALAAPGTTRDDMHDFRNALSDLCALTYPNQDVTAAVAHVVEEADCFAELVFSSQATPVCIESRQRCHDRVWNALQQVIVSLVDAKPSTVARALGRSW